MSSYIHLHIYMQLRYVSTVGVIKSSHQPSMTQLRKCIAISSDNIRNILLLYKKYPDYHGSGTIYSIYFIYMPDIIAAF